MCFCTLYYQSRRDWLKVGRLANTLPVVTHVMGKQSSSRARSLIFQRANSTFPKTYLEKSHGIGL